MSGSSVANGTLVLAAVNTHVDGVVVSGGTLQIDAPLAKKSV